MYNSNLMSGLGGSSDYGEVTMTRGDNNYQLFDFTSVLGETLDLGGQRIGLDDDYWIAPGYDDYTSFGSIGTDLSLVHIDHDAAAEAATVTWDRMPRQDSHSPFFISSYFELNSFQVQLQRADDGSFDISTRYGDSAGLGSLVGYSMGDGYVADIVGAVSDWSVSITRDTRIIGTLNDDDLRAETRVVVDEIMFGGAGNDRMRGYWGEDTLLGGAGGDLFIAGADLVIGGDLDTTNDVDTVSYAEMDGAVRVTLAIFSRTQTNGLAAEGDVLTNIENVIGTGFNDYLRGNGDAD